MALLTWLIYNTPSTRQGATKHPPTDFGPSEVSRILVALVRILPFVFLACIILYFGIALLSIAMESLHKRVRLWVGLCPDCRARFNLKEADGRCKECHVLNVALVAQVVAFDRESYAKERLQLAKEREERRHAAEEEYIRQIRELDNLRALSGIEFEQVVGMIFQRQGYAVSCTRVSGDGGIDLNMILQDKRHIVQCKNWKALVGVKEVRELYGVLCHCRADRAFLVTTSRFTKEARAFAKRAKNLELIDGPTLMQMKHNLRLTDKGESQ